METINVPKRKEGRAKESEGGGGGGIVQRLTKIHCCSYTHCMIIIPPTTITIQ